MKKQVQAVLFWGGLWGISEATISYFVHLYLPGMGWMFYYPLAYGFMWGALHATGKRSTVMYAAVCASAIKLVNLPVVPRVDYVINPAISILLEGFTVWLALLCIGDKEKPLIRYGLLPLLTSAAWRGLYLAYLLWTPQWMRDVSVLADGQEMMRFITLEFMGNALAISLFSWMMSGLNHALKVKLQRAQRVKQILPDTAYSGIALGTVILSILLQRAL